MRVSVRRSIAGGLALVVCLLVASARADVIHLKDGRTIEGKILEENRKSVKIETQFGSVRTIDQDRILRIERKKTAREEYEDRKRRTDDEDAEALYRLGAWCRENGLVVESLEAFRKVIQLDPDHPEARRALGYVRRGDRWILESSDTGPVKDPDPGAAPDRERSRDRSPETGFLEEAGFVQYRGEWVTVPEKRKLQDGLVRYGGRFFTKQDVEKMEGGLVRTDGEWIPFEQADARHANWDKAWWIETLHYKIKSDWPRREIDRLGELLESNYREYARLFGGPPQDPMEVHLFRSRIDYLDYLETRRLEKFSRSDAFYDARTGLVVGWSGKNYDLVLRIIGGVAAWQYYKASYDSAMPGWLSEGISIYFRRFGFDPEGNYVRAKPDRARLEHLVEAMETHNVIPIGELIRLEMFDVIDMGRIKFFSAQSWALVDYLVLGADNDTRGKFVEFIDRLRNTFFVMGNAEFIAAGMMEEIFTPSGMEELERNYLAAARALAREEGLLE